MKSLKLAGLALPALLAVDSFAVVRVVSPISPRINPIAGLPVMLPSPLSGPLSGRGVTFPAPAPTPLLSLAPAAQTPEAPLPRADVNADLPEALSQTSPAANDKTAPSPAAEDDLRGLFDGSRKPADISWEPIFPGARASRSRRYGLPEDELARELGIDPL